MTPQQLAILNSLVTYTAEHIPYGLSVDEREVAQIVGKWALQGRIEEGTQLAHVAYGGYGVAKVCTCSLGRNHT